MSSTRTSSNILEIDDQMIGSLVIVSIFIAITAGVVNYISSVTTIFENSGFSNAIFQILIALIFVIILAILANYKALDFIQDHAEAILIWSYKIFFVFIVGGLGIAGLFFVAVGNIVAGGIFIILALLALWLISRFWERLKQRLLVAAEWLRIATTVVLNEPGMIVLSFIQSLIVGIAAITELFSLIAWFQYADTSGISEEQSKNIVYLILFLYLWLTLSIIYYFDAANTYISYARIKGVDPKVAQGIHAATRKLLSIIFFALISAIVTTIVNVLFMVGKSKQIEGRNSDNIGLVIFGIMIEVISGILAFLYHLISFFTLPSIVLRGNSLKDGMEESYNLFKNIFWDLIISDTGYNFASRIMYLVSGIILGLSGFAYGYFVASAVAGTQSSFFWGLVVGITSLIVGLLVTKFFLRPLYTSLVTTIYVYATEGSDELKIVPAELKKHINNQVNSPRIIRS